MQPGLGALDALLLHPPVRVPEALVLGAVGRLVRRVDEADDEDVLVASLAGAGSEIVYLVNYPS